MVSTIYILYILYIYPNQSITFDLENSIHNNVVTKIYSFEANYSTLNGYIIQVKLL